MTWTRRQKTEEDLASLKGLGRAVRSLREKAGWNQVQIPDRAGLKFTTIYAVERGAMELTWANVRRLTKGLDVGTDALLELAEALAPGEGGERWRRWSWAAERERDVG
jgi:transcriptional regulator with XRE-family HTH domain